MKHTYFIAAIIAAAGIAGASAAVAKQGTGHHGPRVAFEELDADGNGELTKAEMEARRDARFARIDSNGDGKLSAAEIEAEGARRAAERAARMIERHDKDGDGVLSREELPKANKHAAMFSRMDRDGSGVVSKEEFEQARMEMRDKHHKGADCGHEGGHMKGHDGEDHGMKKN